MLEITKLDDPRVFEYLSLKEKVHQSSDTVVIDGKRLVERALAASAKIESLFLTHDLYVKYKPLLRENGVDEQRIFVAKRQLMEEVVGFKLHQGIMAMVERPDTVALRELTSPIVVLNGVNSAENVGSLVRTQVGLGGKSILCDKTTASPFLRRSARVSMGCFLESKVHVSSDLKESLRILKNSGHVIIGAENRIFGQSLNYFECPENAVFIIGSEASGIDKDLYPYIDHFVKIPMVEGGVNSLNAAISGSILLYKYFETYPSTIFKH